MTKLEIIEETVKHYSSNPTKNRAVLRGLCVYTDLEGSHCAVGRCLLPKHQTMNFVGNRQTLVQDLPEKVGKENLDSLLQKKYKGHNIEFWKDLQHLHDTQEFWRADEGLTVLGEDYITKLKNKYKHKN